MDKKKMRITVVFIFLFSGLQALADVAGSMSCVVKSNMVVSISEGVTIRYTGYKDRFEVGDKLILSYHASPIDPEIPIGGSLRCNLKDKARDKIVNMADHTLGSGNHYDAEIRRSDKRSIYTENEFGDMILLSEDFIGCDGIYGRIRLNRYFKSDYEGIFTSRFFKKDLTAQVVTFDCRTIENNIQKVIDLFADK